MTACCGLCYSDLILQHYLKMIFFHVVRPEHILKSVIEFRNMADPMPVFSFTDITS